MKYTPGPWRVELDTLGCKTIHGNIKPNPEIGLDSEIFSVTEIGYTDGLADEIEDEANARLIAAAPELLEALHLLLPALLSKSAMMNAKDWDAVNTANAAIAKAEGREG